MKRLCAIWLLFALALFLSVPAPIPAAIITAPINDQWEIEFDLSPGGDGALSRLSAPAKATTTASPSSRSRG